MKYRVRVTQDVTQSMDIEIEAVDPDEAQDKAIKLALECPSFEVDDGNWHDLNDTYADEPEPLEEDDADYEKK